MLGGGAWLASASDVLASGIEAKQVAQALSGEDIALAINHGAVRINGKAGHAVTVNGASPGPVLRLKEGRTVRLSVRNDLAEDTSIHWHGLLVPFQMDGVPGVSFPGIKPGETFTYEFPVRQSGTYWYHSHSGLQEPMGHYGAIVIEPRDADPVAYDREHVVVLSDYSFTHPHVMMRKLKARAGYYNRRKQTLAGLAAGRDQGLADRLEWARMRMDPTDILDITGAAYSYLINGHGSEDNWSGLFKVGERVRLRFVNAGAMTIFNVRIPGLAFSVVQADGQNLQPVEVDEFQISPAETYDIIVIPRDDQAYGLIAEAADGSGLVRGTLATRPGQVASKPEPRERPLLGMQDMAMDHSKMSDGAGDMAGMDHASMDHAAMGHGDDGAAGAQSIAPPPKTALALGPGVQTIAEMPTDRTGDRGQGLEDVEHRVLVYTDLVALDPNPDPRPPSRSVDIHLTGNMERFMWGFDGEGYGPLTKPIAFARDERVRVRLINDSMMAHPIHLHGHFFEVVNGHPGHHPRKHTVSVAPGGIVDFDLTADEPGDWAFHCHLLFHMHAGMFNVVTVRPLQEAKA
jgi:CopA family copper-resistance protein